MTEGMGIRFTGRHEECYEHGENRITETKGMKEWLVGARGWLVGYQDGAIGARIKSRILLFSVVHSRKRELRLLEKHKHITTKLVDRVKCFSLSLFN